LIIILKKSGFWKSMLNIGTSQSNFSKFCQTPCRKQRNFNKWTNKMTFLTFQLIVIETKNKSDDQTCWRDLNLILDDED
jgi:hypothetical protein